jgi:hypothetical protein
MSTARPISQTGNDAGSAQLSIVEGRCNVLFAYDIGMSIDLDRCERLITEMKQREKLRHRRRAPKHFEYRPLPLRITQQTQPFGAAQFVSSPSVDVVLYDFGAVLVVYDIPLHGPLDALLLLSDELYDNDRLLADSRARVDQLARTIAPAIAKPHSAESVEDYVIYEIRQLATADGPAPVGALQDAIVAQILRSERAQLSQEEINDAAACRISFTRDDVTIIDWNAAFVFDKESDDVVAVLEYANVELLEMRHLDQKLDDALTEAYDVLSQRRPRRGLHADTDRVAQLQVDAAMMFEGVNNSLKLLGDQYLARVYQVASQRFHLAEWDASIMRKLQTLDSIYGKMTDRAGTRRMELLEWIIIILFVVSIVMPFITGIQH